MQPVLEKRRVQCAICVRPSLVRFVLAKQFANRLFWWRRGLASFPSNHLAQPCAGSLRGSLPLRVCWPRPKPPKDFNSEFTTNGLTLYLDNVADPGNVGTLIRVADWFGLSCVVVSPQSADPIGPKAVQSAMGSTFHIPIAVRASKTLPEEMKAHAVGLDAGGQNLFEDPFDEPPTLLVVGSESHGVSQHIKARCHSMAAIPGAGRAESLNASVAAPLRWLQSSNNDDRFANGATSV